MVRFCYGSKPLCPSCRQESHPTRVRGVHRNGSETAQNDLLQHQTKVAHLQDGHCAQNRVSMSLLCLFAGRVRVRQLNRISNIINIKIQYMVANQRFGL